MKKKPLRLLVLVSAFARNKDDSGDFTLDLTKRLLKFGFDIDVLAPHDYGLKIKEKIADLKITRFIYFYPRKYQKLAYGGGMPYNLKNSFLAKIQVPFFFISELFKAVYLVKNKKIDVVQSHWLLPQGLTGALIQKYWKVSHVATLHSSEVTLLKRIPGGKFLAGFILINSTKIVSVSRHRLEEILAFVDSVTADEARSKALVIPMGVDLKAYKLIDRKKHSVTDGRPKILFVGRLVDVKGCEYLVRAFKEVVKKLPKANLIIIGTGPLEEKLKKLCFELKISDHVNFVGFVDHQSIGSYYADSDIIVFPSIVDPYGYQEGLPVVLLEALASGKPVVATDIKGSLELVEDGYNGLLVKQANSGDLAKKIIQISQKSNLDKMSLNALKTSQKYDWEIISKQYAAALKCPKNMIQ